MNIEIMKTNVSTTRRVGEIISATVLLLVSLPIFFSVGCAEGLDIKNERYPNGLMKYIGNAKDGKYHGLGTLWYENGPKEYHGYFKEGQFSGEGKFYTRNGDLLYEGSFKEGHFHGHGQTFYPNGKIHYSGEWRKGKRNGEGTLYYKDGTLAYEGEWENDRRHGHGKFYIYGKLVYDGRFSQGKMLDKSGHVVNQKPE